MLVLYRATAAARKTLDHATLPVVMELLESRRFMSVTFEDGLLSVVGTNQADVFRVSSRTSAATGTTSPWPGLTVNGRTKTYGSVLGLAIDARGGNDNIQIFAEATPAGRRTVDTTLLGGGGNDEITGSYTNDYIDGGAGHDMLCGSDGLTVGDGGRDRLFGGTGVDSLGGVGPDPNRVYFCSGEGNDTVWWNFEDRRHGTGERTTVVTTSPSSTARTTQRPWWSRRPARSRPPIARAIPRRSRRPRRTPGGASGGTRGTSPSRREPARLLRRLLAAVARKDVAAAPQEHVGDNPSELRPPARLAELGGAGRGLLDGCVELRLLPRGEIGPANHVGHPRAHGQRMPLQRLLGRQDPGDVKAVAAHHLGHLAVESLVLRETSFQFLRVRVAARAAQDHLVLPRGLGSGGEVIGAAGAQGRARGLERLARGGELRGLGGVQAQRLHQVSRRRRVHRLLVRELIQDRVQRRRQPPKALGPIAMVSSPSAFATRVGGGFGGSWR
jgi:hypothetical protein